MADALDDMPWAGGSLYVNCKKSFGMVIGLAFDSAGLVLVGALLLF